MQESVNFFSYVISYIIVGGFFLAVLMTVIWGVKYKFLKSAPNWVRYGAFFGILMMLLPVLFAAILTWVK